MVFEPSLNVLDIWVMMFIRMQGILHLRFTALNGPNVVPGDTRWGHEDADEVSHL
jgi:hypothetical protein